MLWLLRYTELVLYLPSQQLPLLRCVHLFSPCRRCPSSCCWLLRRQLMGHGLKRGGREGAGRKEQSIIFVACISSDFLLLARLPRWIDTKKLVVASHRDFAMPLWRLIRPLTLSNLGKNANNNPRYWWGMTGRQGEKSNLSSNLSTSFSLYVDIL